MIAKNSINLFNYVSVGICVIDINFKILCWNNSLANLTKIESDEALGKFLYDFYPEFKKTINIMRINDVAAGGPPVIFSASLNKSLFAPYKNLKENYYFEIIASPLDIDDVEDKLVIFSVEDRTSLYKKVIDYKQVKDLALVEIEQRKKVEESLKLANQSKDKFISIMAHDIKNPLGVIQSVSDFLLKSYKELEEDEISEFLNGMFQSSKKLNSLINDLLTWARTQSGRLKANLSDYNLYDITKQVVDLLHSNAEKKSIKLINKVAPDIILNIDHFMIDTVLRNLTSNAIKFTNDGGKIELKATKDDNHYIISVDDTGVGIKKEDIAKLFSLGESKSKLGTNKEEGTGLGLLLCKEFINLHNGNIWVESEIGKGSSFKFSIPISQS